MKGKRLPQVGVIEFSVIEEMQTRTLEFERGKLDWVELKGDGAQHMLKNGDLDPALAARGIRRQIYPYGTRSAFFNMDDPVVGGMGKEHIALRRAIALGFDDAALSSVVLCRPGASRQPDPAAGRLGLRSGAPEQAALRPGGCDGPARPLRLRQTRRGWVPACA